MAAAPRSPRTAPAAPRHPIPLTTLVLVVLSAAALLQGCGRQDDAGAIRTLVARESEATQKEDLQALAEIWSQDKGILLFTVGANGRAQGWDKIARVFKEFFDQASDLKLTVGALEVTVSGDLAYATYDWAMTGRAGEYALDDRGHATAIYRREKPGWKMVHAHYSPLHPALAAAAAGDGASPAATPAPAGTPKR